MSDEKKSNADVWSETKAADSKTDTKNDGVITCDACPVLCRIRESKTGACSRYGNVEGTLTRTDPLVVTQQISDENGDLVPFLPDAEDGKQLEWDGSLNFQSPSFVTGIGATTTYPDYKPAPFIVSSEHHGVDMVTVVTEGIRSSKCSMRAQAMDM